MTMNILSQAGLMGFDAEARDSQGKTPRENFEEQCEESMPDAVKDAFSTLLDTITTRNLSIKMDHPKRSSMMPSKKFELHGGHQRETQYFEGSASSFKISDFQIRFQIHRVRSAIWSVHSLENPVVRFPFGRTSLPHPAQNGLG